MGSSTATGAGGGALSGAAAGSVFGPIGTLVGAGVGAAGGGYLGSQVPKSPDAPALAADPTYGSMFDKAKADELKALQAQASGDTASIMARYGTRLAFAGSTAPTLAKM